MWNDSFVIGDGTPVSEDASYPIYRSYQEDCGITVTQEVFNRDIQTVKIFQESRELSGIVFTPKDVLKQTTTGYYFAHLDIKIPRRS